ncbi:hypothetical protein C8F01DRAFT_1119198 [Mycena amicta]|nr:hypothetical protein C8F01DRAFT_1119198 [Mycena amicta]
MFSPDNAALRDLAALVSLRIEGWQSFMAYWQPYLAELVLLPSVVKRIRGLEERQLRHLRPQAKMDIWTLFSRLTEPQQNDLLSTLPATVAGMEKCMAQTQSEIDNLQAEKLPLQSQLDAIVYPALTLPPEIISEIFTQCEYPHRGYTQPTAPPFLLVQICRAWRSIALRTPALWREYEFRISNLSSRVAHLPEFMETLFSRAQTRSIFVHLSGSETIECPPRVFDVIRRFTGNIRELELDSLLVTDMDEIDWSTTEFPRLFKLQLTPETFHLPPSHIEIFSNAPNLRDVTLTANIPLSSISLPWTQLIHFRGHKNFQTQMCLEALQLVSNATSCEFQMCEDEDDIVLPSSILVHETLRSLRLRSESFISLALLPLISLPGLHSLEIVGLGEPEVLENFLISHSSSLRELSLQCYHDWVYGMSALFHSVQILADLRISSLTFQGATYGCLFLLFDSLGKPDFLPALESLFVTGHYRLGSLNEHMLHIGEALSRRVASSAVDHEASPQRLESVFVAFQTLEESKKHVIPEEVLAPFRDLLLDGMEIEIVLDERWDILSQ